MIVGVGLALAAALPAAPASALNARTFVSGHGNDANPCNFSGPCRTFAAAYANTAPGGEITVLDPAGYGPLTITTALSIVNDGVGEAGVILIAAGNAITISAGVSDAVSLRGLTLDGGGVAGTNGILFNTGKSLTVTNCVVRHFADNGISFFPNASSNLAVSNTVAADNGGAGMRVLPTGAGTVKASFNRVELYNNVSQGLIVTGTTSTGTVNGIVTDSVAANNASSGFHVNSTSAATSLMVIRSVSANNVTGLIAASANATLRFSQSALTGNTFSWAIGSGAILRSYGDNNIDGNGDGDPAPTTIALK
jgi:hypothetical protein